MKHLLCIALFLVCTSCGLKGKPFKAYPGEKRPVSEIAILKTQKGNGFHSGIFISRLDNKLYALDFVEVLPGEHSISVSCRRDRIFFPRLYRDRLKVDVIGGHSYEIIFQGKQFCLRDVDEDTITTCGEAVKGSYWGGGTCVPPIIW